MAFHVLRGATLTATTSNPPLILNPDNPAYYKDTAPSSITLAGVKYHRHKVLAKNQPARKSRSLIWSFGEKLIKADDKKPFYYCYECEDENRTQELPSLDYTTGGRTHMSSTHNRDPDTGEVITGKVVPKAVVFSIVKQESVDKFKALLVRWFVVCQLAFFMLENTVFRDLMKYLSAGLVSVSAKGKSNASEVDIG